MYTQSQIDPLITFRNSQGEAVRGTIINLQRKSLVMEVYNPYSIVQVSEVLDDLTVRFGTGMAYQGRAVVVSLVNTGLTAIVSVTLIDEWHELDTIALEPGAAGAAARAFVVEWTKRFHIRPGYQIAVNELRAFLADVSRWVEQVDLSESLPKESGQLRTEVFYELIEPLVEQTRHFLTTLEKEASQVPEDLDPTHRSFAQTALHPLMLRAPFVFRTYTKPLGYAGDYEMVNQILDEPRKGPNTYFQMVNTVFLQAAVAIAHRHRIDILESFLNRTADAARKAGRTFRVLNVGCGPAIEIQRFLRNYPEPECLSFELVDFSAETLGWTRDTLRAIMTQTGKAVSFDYVHDSVHNLLKRRADSPESSPEFDATYCAGLFDYLSDKVCSRLTAHFAGRTRSGGTLMITNVHSSNPVRYCMDHLLDWHLIYRDEEKMASLLPPQADTHRIYTDSTGVNIFAEIAVR